MRLPELKFSWLFAVGFVFVLATSVTAQSTALDGFGVSTRPSFSNRQRSPHRQLAQRITPSEQDRVNKTQAPATKADDKAAKPEKKPISKKRRAELMEFVKANHPELQPLLKQLESKRNKQFQSALRTLDKNVRNLQGMEKKSPVRYQRALDLWCAESRIQLLSAQLATKKSDKEKNSIRKKIRSLFEKQFELEQEQLAASAKAAKKRYDRLSAQLKAHQENRDAEIARKLKEIDKTSQRVSAMNKSSDKNQPIKKEKANPKVDVEQKEKAKPKETVKPEKKTELAPKKNTPPKKSKPPIKPTKEKAKPNNTK